MLTIPFNAQGLEREGIDLEATYTKDLADFFSAVPGTVTLHSLVAFVNKNIISSGGAVTNNVGLVSGAAGNPRWHGIFDIHYALDKWDFYLKADVVGAGVVENVLSKTIPNYLQGNHIPMKTYFDANIQYEVDDNFQVFAGVDNILNQSPPVTGASTNTTTSRTNSSWYDIIGRQYKAGVRFNF